MDDGKPVGAFVITPEQASALAGRVNYKFLQSFRCPHCNEEITIAVGQIRLDSDTPS